MGDRVRVIAEETNKKSYKVLVLGEVLQPGYIYITKNNSTLGDVVQKSGGLTKNAWLKKGQLLRGVNANFMVKDEPLTEMKEKEISRNLRFDRMLMVRMSNISPEDTTYFKLESELINLNEMGLLDFTGLDDKNSEISNKIVKDGDVIIIPEFENIVNVFGQVPNIGKYEFVEGKGYMYYINKAGGFGDEADEDVMLIKANTKSWIPVDDEEARVEPGDYIWIPKEPQRDLEFYLKNSGSVAAIVSAIATILVLINQLGK